jgi:hypothetical protein
MVLFAAAVAGACALRSPNIGDIQYNPGRYYDRTVEVEGVVSSAWGLPFVPFKVYKIEDGTGEMTVISQSTRVPPKGARVQVRGRVEEFATFGGRSLGLHIREDRLRVNRRW